MVFLFRLTTKFKQNTNKIVSVVAESMEEAQTKIANSDLCKTDMQHFTIIDIDHQVNNDISLHIED